jgi:hypothetical protein
MNVELSPELYFSYSQFVVYDREIDSRACDWTSEHCRQGFARRDHTVAVGTLLEFGHAAVRVCFGHPKSLDEYERVIAVPLVIESGWLAVDGVEEHPIDRMIKITPATYRTIIAQRVVDDEREQIDIFLDSYDGRTIQSEILVADDDLDPPERLVETSQVPDV